MDKINQQKAELLYGVIDNSDFYRNDVAKANRCLLYTSLLNLNSVVMPLRYLWVFVAFIAVVRLAQKYKPEYVFIRNKPLAMTVGIWCFAFTAFACLTGIFPKMEAFTAEWTFQLALNVRCV